MRRFKAALILCAMTAVQAATLPLDWRELSESYRSVGYDESGEQWARHFWSALTNVYPAWISMELPNPAPDSVRRALQNPPTNWTNVARISRKTRQTPAAFELELIDFTEETDRLVWVLGNRTGDEWLFLDQDKPAHSMAGSWDQLRRKIFDDDDLMVRTNRALLRPFSIDLAALMKGNFVLQQSRPAQPASTNYLWGRSEDPIVVRFPSSIRPTLSNTNEDLAVFWTNGFWWVPIVARKAVTEPFDIELRTHSGWLLIDITNVLVGDVWLLAGGMNSSLGITTNAPDEGVQKKPVRLLSPEVYVSSQAGNAFSIESSAWRLSNELGWPALARALANQRTENDPPLGLIVVAAGATAVDSWLRPATPAGPGGARRVKDLWIVTPETAGTNSDDYSYVRGDIYNGTLEPLLWPSGPANGKPISVSKILWFHGEWTATQSTNAAQTALEYRATLQQLIAEWQASSGLQSEFYICQLSSPAEFSGGFQHPEQNSWLQLQIAQWETARQMKVSLLPLVGLETAGIRLSTNSVASWLLNELSRATNHLPPLAALKNQAIALTLGSNLDPSSLGSFAIVKTNFSQTIPRWTTLSAKPETNSATVNLPVQKPWTSGLKIYHLGGLKWANGGPVPIFSAAVSE